MEPISFGLAIIAEARTLVDSVKNRLKNFQEGQRRFQSLTYHLDLLVRHIAEVERLLQTFPSALPNSVAALVEETLADVRDCFKDENSAMPPSLEKAFVGSSSVMGKLSSKAHQLARAKALSHQLNALQNKIEKSSNQLQYLISVLANALKVDEHQAAVTSKIDENHNTVLSRLDDLGIAANAKQMKIDENHNALLSKLDSLSVAETVKEVYGPAVTTPAPSHTFVLDFYSRDNCGSPTSPEGVLKQSVLHGQSSQIVTAATGAIKPAYGILGMAGVGKTVALQGLAHDEEVKERFHGGILYMKFGRGATLQTALREIAKIMSLTGATTNVENVKRCECLRDAVDYAVMWFEGKVCLYLLDDLWPAENMPPDYFQDLRQLLRGSSQSRMAISTRCVSIASEAGCIVDFGPRSPLGNVAVNMFMSHATGPSAPKSSSAVVHDLRPSLSKILAICGGLPIALSVTGCAVSKLVRMYGTFEKACDVYAAKLERKRTVLGDKSATYGMSLNAAIELSLEYLEVEFSEWISENSIEINANIFDLYGSLCVLSNQAWVPVSVLGRMWQLEKDAAFEVASLICEMSLARIEARAPSTGLPVEAGIVLHDLQLDFCQQNATETKKFSFWHARLLQGYLETTIQPTSEEEDKEAVQRIVDYAPRQWWAEAVPDDGYIHANLSRHLSAAACTTELAALLLDARWTQLRGRIGGILALKADFELIKNVLEQDRSACEMKQSFQSIFKAVQLSWGRMAIGLRVFQFQVCGRLAGLRKSNAVVEAFLKSIEKCTPKPYLLPVSSFFPDVDSSLIMEIPVGGECKCVACSPCGSYMAYGAGSDVVIAKSSNGEIVQRMQGHERSVTCIAFGERSKDVVSGSVDGTVMFWDWELSKYFVRVFEGHKGQVTGVAVSRDGSRIFSSSWDKTLKIFDVATTAKSCELHGSCDVRFVAIWAEGEMVAFGCDDGKLRVVDSLTTDILFDNAEVHERVALCASFCPSGSYLATGSWDGTIRFWNTRTWTEEGECLSGHRLWVTCVSFSHNGKQIASSSDDGTIRLWDVESRKCVGKSPKITAGITSICFTMDGQKIVSGSRDGIVRIWDARLGTKPNGNTFEQTCLVSRAVISQNGLRVASLSGERTVALWDAQTGEKIGVSFPLKAHAGPVYCVSISPDGRQLVSGSHDETLRLWDTATHTQIGDPFKRHLGPVHSVWFSLDGLRVVSSSSHSSVQIWDAETHKKIGETGPGVYLSSYCVSESSNGEHVVCRYLEGIVYIWNRHNQSIVWKSEQHSRSSRFENKITDDEAESIIRSCGQQTPHLWPKSFPAYTAELYFVRDSVFSNLLGEKTLLADTLEHNMSSPSWSYHTGRNIFAAGLASGAVAICKLITG